MRDIIEWSKWMAAANKSRNTIDLRIYHVRRVLKEVGGDPWEITVDQLVGFLAAGAESGWKPNYLRTWRASLRSFYTWGQGVGRRPDNPAILIPAVQLPRSVARPTPDAVYEAAEHDADERVRLMIHLAALCGLRRGEITMVRAEDLGRDWVIDINEETGEASTRMAWLLYVKGKGGHERYVPVEDELAVRIRARGPGWIFPSPYRPGPLTPAHVGKLVTQALPGFQWTTHTLRHRAGTKAYAGTKDLRAVQEFLGHAKPETTMIYTMVPKESIRAAMRAAAA